MKPHVISCGSRAASFPRALAAFVSTLVLACGWNVRSASDSVPRVAYPESIRPVPPAAEAAPGARPIRAEARVVRTGLTPAETAAPIDFSLPLRMRNFAELQARVARGDLIPREEMAEKYLPLAADYYQVAAWAVTRGFTVTAPDASHLTVFLRGPVSRLAEVFQTTFARVAADGSEFTSALTAPSVPMALAAAVLGVNGLQPHVRAHKQASAATMRPMSLTAPNAPPYLPAEFLRGYNASLTGLTGTGQTIAIVIDTYATSSDLTAFWTRCGVSQSLANVQVINVPGTPTPPDPAAVDPSSGVAYGVEAAIDAELTSSIAPSARIRIYTTGNLADSNLYRAYSQILQDLPTQPDLHQVNLSYGGREDAASADGRQADSQVFAALAAAGVTIVASSSDAGSNPDSNGRYDPAALLQPALPAADPSVTAVGATNLALNPGTGAWSAETAWSITTYGSGQTAGSGGGASRFFGRPSWQLGTGVPAGTMRLVPDVSVVGDPATGAYIVSNGSDSTTWGGTSISAPLWSGFCALLNQARATAGQQPLGLFGPRLYPLIGTASLHDITSGTNGRGNGAYFPGIGYDMVTGVGTPNMAALALALGASAFAPSITSQPSSQTTANGQNATFRVTVIGNPEPAYRWQRAAAGGGAWGDLTNAAPYGGVDTASLTVSSVTEAMSGDSFQCVITNSVGAATTLPAVLIVASPLAVTTLAGSPGANGSADGTGSAARFNRPADLAVDGTGNVFVTDTNNHTIRKITPAGVVTTLAGLAGTSGPTDGTGNAARFNNPQGIAVDGSGNLFVADTGNHTIRRVTSAGAVTTLAGTFNAPADVAVDQSGNLYVADAGDHTIRLITPAGDVSTLAGLAGAPGSADGAGGAARFSAPEGVAVDGAGNLYVADSANSTIRKIVLATRTVSTLAGLAGASGTSDGVGSSARFQFPSDLALDRTGNLLVADTDNHTIRKVSPTGATGTVAGQAGVNGSTDGSGSAARFYFPTGVAVDAAGNVYVADTNNNTIRSSIISVGPAITAQPQSQSVTVGATAQFSVTATGTPAPTYQWRLNNTAIAGATSPTLTLTGVQFTDGGTYTVTVANLAGTVTSIPATLTVNPTTTIPPSGGGGGGGAPSLWFCGALAVLAAVHRVFPRRPIQTRLD